MKKLVPLLLALGCLLAAPAAASAATYTVNDTGDEVDKSIGTGGCETAVAGKCSLRAAIQESNSSTGVTDEIKFAAAFNGQGEDTISIATSLPTITDPVHIDGDSGGQCTTEAGQAGPCAGVNGPASGSAILVEDDGVVIDGLAITGAAGNGGSAGIFVINASEGFVARDNWLGVKLDGTAGANSKGIYIDPGSDGATIGGTASADRNVLANNNIEGLDVEGASDTDVLGNYFGVKPDGTTAAANNKDIEITDTIAFEATGNEVGATVASGNAPCDGGCNVISGATGAGVDLQGNGEGQNELPATGPTIVHGNFIGLNATGTETRANTTGINVGEATDALIGGSQNEDANYIAGGGKASSPRARKASKRLATSSAPARPAPKSRLRGRACSSSISRTRTGWRSPATPSTWTGASASKRASAAPKSPATSSKAPNSGSGPKSVRTLRAAT